MLPVRGSYRLQVPREMTGHGGSPGIMAAADIKGPQACLKGLRRGFGIAAVVASVPLPTIATNLGHANLQPTAVYTPAAGLKTRNVLARMWKREANSARSGA